MGCTCVRRIDTQEINNGKLPEEDNNLKGEKKFNENNDFPDNNININTDFLTSNQDRNDEIYNYFNDLRNSPKNFLEEAKKYDLADFITSAETKKKSENINILIQNPFFNLFLDNYVQKYRYSKEEIMKSLEQNVQIQSFQKNLYSSEGSVENPKECIWNLIKENKDIAVNEILYKKIDYIIISSISIPDSKKILVYFLLLKKNL